VQYARSRWFGSPTGRAVTWLSATSAPRECVLSWRIRAVAFASRTAPVSMSPRHVGISRRW
jgi:hypothetical protein